MKAIFLLFISFIFICMQSPQSKKEQPVTIVIHGGAGTMSREKMTPEAEKAYREKLNEALDAGYKILQNGGSSLDAVEAAVKIMEDSPLFNAGKGSVFNSEGKNEMDASIMDGKTLKAGSVAGVTVIKNPITAARAVMDKSAHVMLTGKGAEEFAKQQGAEIVDPSYFYDEQRYKEWKKAKEKEGSGSIKPPGEKFGTVGAVALDKAGNLAAATSTGGMTNKKFGRIGDSPIIGAGTYANNKTCAVSCTGHGEYFIRLNIAHDLSALMEYKKYAVEKAADEVIYKKLAELGGTGGLIALDAKGNFAMPFNTSGMYHAVIDKRGNRTIEIFRK